MILRDEWHFHGGTFKNLGKILNFRPTCYGRMKADLRIAEFLIGTIRTSGMWKIPIKFVKGDFKPDLVSVLMYGAEL